MSSLSTYAVSPRQARELVSALKGVQSHMRDVMDACVFDEEDGRRYNRSLEEIEEDEEASRQELRERQERLHKASVCLMHSRPMEFFILAGYQEGERFLDVVKTLCRRDSAVIKESDDWREYSEMYEVLWTQWIPGAREHAGWLRFMAAAFRRDWFICLITLIISVLTTVIGILLAG